jgi:hypothetical protein
MMERYQRIKFQAVGREGGAFKKRLAPCHKGMGLKLNFGIKNFQGELSKHFYIYIFLLQSKLECKLTTILTT